jgi:serine protease Do
MDKPQGALVGSVKSDGPAAKAGIQAGDVILSVNGTPVTDASELRSRIAGLSPGATADIGVWRNGSRKSLSVTVGVMSGVKESQKESPKAAPQPTHARLGVAVRPLSPEELDAASLPSGLLVEQAQGPAAQAGIQSGDVILAVDGKRVTSVNQLRQMISQAGDQVSLLVQRDGERVSVPVELG